MITASAPGKVVLWGEYAVLTGAAALVMAVNRRATCTIEPGGGSWRFRTRGFAALDADLDTGQLVDPQHAPDPAARVVCYALRHLRADAWDLPAGANVVTDSSGFYARTQKLGIGSSAAVCTAVYAACCRFLATRPDFGDLLTLHNTLQNASGSGVDVAAAFYGGALRYVAPQVARSGAHGDAVPAQRPAAVELPDNLHFRFFWSGHSEATAGHVTRFREWLATGDTAPIETLRSTCEELFANPRPALLARYVDELKALDIAASLGIYGPAHQRLDELANTYQVVYKPCGAGGGDIGVAISDDPERVVAFTNAAKKLEFEHLPLEIARDGVQVAG